MRLRSLAALLLLAFVSLAGCPPNEVVTPQKKEACTNGVDDDGDEKVDCFDPDCFTNPSCQRVMEDCRNGIDDDRNGKTDCDDTTCASDPTCNTYETCDNGVDDNGNGLIDCADAIDCRTAAHCGDGGAEAPDACADTLDNDNDGTIDCKDSECLGQSCGTGCECRNLGKYELNCTDGVDNDGDSKIDCLDGPDCDGTSCGMGCVCQSGAKKETSCVDRQDNDGDGLRDCADTMDCSGSANFCGTGSAETGTACYDGLDNDLDGDRDCEDASCAGAACGTGCTCNGGRRTESSCSDGADNDGDGMTDCVDADCVGAGSETSCTDGRDDNCNGLVDCADNACSQSVSCTNLAIGKACSSNLQCLSGRCLTESVSGWPSGACVGAAGGCSLDAGVSYGCAAGSACTTDQYGTFCRQQCSGSGATACRAAYACHENPDEDYEGPRTCTPLCATDADCNRNGGSSYGCNPWSKRCEPKQKNLKKYGEACGGNTQCESGLCLGGEGGYCYGLCVKGGAGCASDGTCGNDDFNDNTGRCFDSCTTSAECTRGGDYLCKPAPWGGATTQVCYCSRLGEPCGGEADCCNKHPLGLSFPPACLLGACAF